MTTAFPAALPTMRRVLPRPRIPGRRAHNRRVLGLGRARAYPAELVAVRAAFEACVAHVDLGQRAMIRCVPSSARSTPLPLDVGAQTLRLALAEAAAAMPAWRDPAIDTQWLACEQALADTLAAVDRCVAIARDTVELEVALTAVSDLLAPLHAFVDADEQLRSLRI